MEAENLLDLDPAPEVRAHLDSIRGVAEKGMNEIRNMALLLRPSMLDDFGLLPALEWQAREIGKRTGLRVQVTSEMPGELPEEHKTCVYRVVQEALTNAIKHAGPARAQVRVTFGTDCLELEIIDTGHGTAPGNTAPAPDGHGLTGMQERLALYGGQLDAGSGQGGGFTVHATIPLLDEARRIQRELRVRIELRDDVVIVGVEPLGHLTGGNAAAARAVIVAALRRTAARHAEVVVERMAVKAAHTLGQIAECKAHVQHLVIEGEVADGCEVEACLSVPVALAQLRADGLQFFARRLVFPVFLEGELEFALCADARKTKVMCCDHFLCAVQRREPGSDDRIFDV